MKSGGYQIIDLGGVNLTTLAPTTIPGIYDRLEGSRKAVLLSGIQIAGTEYRDDYVAFSVSETNFVGTAYGHTITIAANDEVTVAAQ